MENTYNGWTNYATWRVNLEIFEDIDTDNWAEDIENLSAYEFSEYLKDYTEELIYNQVDTKADTALNFAESYALAFIDKVNWGEIAIGIIDTYKENYLCDNCCDKLEEQGDFCSNKCKKEYGLLADHPKG